MNLKLSRNRCDLMCEWVALVWSILGRIDLISFLRKSWLNVDQDIETFLHLVLMLVDALPDGNDQFEVGQEGV